VNAPSLGFFTCQTSSLLREVGRLHKLSLPKFGLESTTTLRTGNFGKAVRPFLYDSAEERGELGSGFGEDKATREDGDESDEEEIEDISTIKDRRIGGLEMAIEDRGL
jgi:hypothetical protein